MTSAFVIGLDFGTDSVRALLVDSSNGAELSNGIHHYTRWKQKKYCNPSRSQFRQHPLDYIEGIEASVKSALSGLGKEIVENIRAIGIDATGSTPAAVNKDGLPLALVPEFAEDPDAMFVLWKDHTAQEEANEINELAHRWTTDFTQYSGGDYSPEWFWSKILQITRNNPLVREHAYTWVEQSDWIPMLLTGNKSPNTWTRNRCAAGHKAMWHESFGGLPSAEFLSKLHPALATLRDNLCTQTAESDTKAGLLSDEWSVKLGLPPGIIVATGIIDAHAGAVGANIEANTMVKVTGTSTCDMVVVQPDIYQNKLIRGICGQVNGSIIPGMLGLEAGQSAFGDLYNWFVQILMYPYEVLKISDSDSSKKEFEKKIFSLLEDRAQQLPLNETDPVSLDWINGRRTPDVNLELKSAIAGLQLGTDAAAIYKSLVEATAFGSRAIMQRFDEENIPIHKVIAVGGISKSSAYVMQVLSNVLNRPIHIIASDQTCALGASIFAAKAANLFPTFKDAQKAMAAPVIKEFHPQADRVNVYDRLYLRYLSLGKFMSKKNG